MKSKYTIILILFIVTIQSSGQSNNASFTAPEPTKTYEFTKYDQIPVGEYTGVPQINIPLYTAIIDEVKIPINLSYHAGGFRVSEEASNVGLGWSLNFGIITQTINDEDDLNPIKFKKLLKYQDSPTTGIWPIKCETLGVLNSDLCFGLGGENCNPEPSYPIGIPKVTNSIFIATDQSYPIVGMSYCATESNLDFYNWDSEPDIFRVNFFGHSFKFIKIFEGPNQGQIEILDNKGYMVEMMGDNWKIIVPNGDQYIFGLKRKDEIQVNTWGNPLGMNPSESSGSTTGSTNYNNSWSLIQIITNKNKIVNFEYTDFGISPSRSYNQKLMIPTSVSSYMDYGPVHNVIQGYYCNPPVLNYNYLINSVFATYEKALYVKKISSPSEEIILNYSERTDRGNDRKLDLITIKNNKQQFIKDFNFVYNYFLSPQTGGEIVPPPNGIYSTDLLGRLKLLSVKESGNNPYYFEYNSTNLPKKNSNAVDFWGMYNGKNSNTSLVPNPFALGFTNLINNGNDKSAYENYAKACVLEGIVYPTGGKVTYQFELNEYQKATFEIPLTNSGNIITNSIVKGNGLRVKSISLFDKNVLQRKTIYTYLGGKNIIPFNLKSDYSTEASILVSGANARKYSVFSITEFNSSNFVSSSIFNSFNAIGYDEVTSEDVGQSGNGKTVWTFMNVQDEKSVNDVTATFNRIQLPSLMKINTTENGKILTEEVFENNNINPVLSKVFKYNTKQSNIYYGNSIVPFRSLIGYNEPQPGQITPRVDSQELVGYYAIYSKQSFLSSLKVTEYFSTGLKWNITNYNYDINNLILGTTTSDESNNVITSNMMTPLITPYLIAKNRLNLPKKISTSGFGSPSKTLEYSYQEFGPLFLPVSTIELPNGSPAPEYKKKIFYDQYDEMGNILQFHDEQNFYTCVIWGYNKQLPIAKIENATYSQIQSYVANLQSLSNTGAESNLINALNALRNNLPNAFVTTYTHIPLVGIRTVTDSKGYKTSYQYDVNNRLSQIIDSDGNIINENKYNFRTN